MTTLPDTMSLVIFWRMKFKKKVRTRTQTAVIQPVNTTSRLTLPAWEPVGLVIHPPHEEVDISMIHSKSNPTTTTTTITATIKQEGATTIIPYLLGRVRAVLTTTVGTRETRIPSNLTYSTQKVLRCFKLVLTSVMRFTKMGEGKCVIQGACDFIKDTKVLIFVVQIVWTFCCMNKSLLRLGEGVQLS